MARGRKNKPKYSGIVDASFGSISFSGIYDPSFTGMEIGERNICKFFVSDTEYWEFVIEKTGENTNDEMFKTIQCNGLKQLK